VRLGALALREKLMRYLGILASLAMIAYAIYKSDQRGSNYDEITAVSIAYFVLMLALFVLTARQGRGGRRGFAIFMAIAAVGMAGFSTMLSGAISFDEVFVAWVGYAAVAALSLMLPAQGAAAR